MGAWIEIGIPPGPVAAKPQSHPSRVRGLKFQHRSGLLRPNRVAPFTGAWIEIASCDCPCSL